MALHQLVYYSRNTVLGDDRALLQQLREVIGASQRNNKRDAVTGYLIFDKTWFLQILEGERQVVFTTFGRIENDRRHRDLRLVQSREILARDFPAWTMGGSMRSPEVQGIYLQHGIGGALDPTKLRAPTILSLARSLQDFEGERKTAQKVAS